MIIGLNLSTADEKENDPTIMRCIEFARSWDYGGFCMGNLFAFRATEPADTFSASDPENIDFQIISHPEIWDLELGV